ncbi:MAG: TetM/TetW/TetO/TetS family tetracycline resistance ribosomal protection protein [Clostridiales bacterium]|jgi:small GTP-binding protein|nr:TetM/TetW/TetO/TetS family tetracycline resistance ribosomal protection protein [Clostridiales bacterium]
MKTCIGVFAHVDAGKTTFCEALLYLGARIPELGRVDHESSTMDHDAVEKRRGITIFSDVAEFSLYGRDFCLIDTPGHVDFSAEMERALSVLDAAILIISAVDCVQSHTLTLYKLLRKRRIPIYLFLNKMDQPGADASACLIDARDKLSQDIFLLEEAGSLNSQALIEWICDRSDKLLEDYINSGGDISELEAATALTELIKSGGAVLALSGSALRLRGVGRMIEVISKTLPAPIYRSDEAYSGRVFKVIHDPKGARVSFARCLSGNLKVKDEVECKGLLEKVHEIRIYNGESYYCVPRIESGDVAGIVGLAGAVPGTGLGDCPDLPAPTLQPAIRASVNPKSSSIDAVFEVLKKYEAGDPLIEVSFERANNSLSIRAMGAVQLEVLREAALARHGLDIGFGDFKVVYKETIAKPVMGFGHFEPLRHYAEVHFRLEPNPGGGIAFASELSADRLPMQHQNAIRHFVLARDHKGVLTGSSVTDMKVILANGAVHLKHTDGGDLREASWRAIRQGLEKAESILLEPYYEFEANVNMDHLGRLLSDLARLRGEFSPPEPAHGRALVRGRGPVETLMNYPIELASFTKGTGSISNRFLGFFPCCNSESAIASIGYEKERDAENTSSSIFCSKGTGFEIKWNEAEAWMHLEKSKL